MIEEINKYNAKVIIEELLCPKCKLETMKSSNFVYACDPPRYRYECTKCGEVVVTDKAYPNYYFEKTERIRG